MAAMARAGVPRMQRRAVGRAVRGHAGLPAVMTPAQECFVMNVQRLARLFWLSAALMLAVSIFGTDSGVASASTCLSWAGTPPVSPSANGDTLVGVAVHS